MKTKLMKFGAWLMAAALAFAGAGAYGAITTQAELDAAVAAAKAGEVVEITAAGTYKMPSIPANITIKAASGVAVKIDATGGGNICGTTAGATFEGLEFTFGNTSYHGFQASGGLTFNNCTLDGLFFSYGRMTFNNCTFIQTTGEYNMWCYAGNIVYSGCTFDSQGKFLNIYNEGNGEWSVKCEDCLFISGKANKAALNVKDTCGKIELPFCVTINNCRTQGLFPAAADLSGRLLVLDPLVQVDDIKEVPSEKIVKEDNNLNITMDGELIYPVIPQTNVKVDTKDVEVKDASGKVITDEKATEAVQAIAAEMKALDVANTETGLNEAVKKESESDVNFLAISLKGVQVAKDTGLSTVTYEVKPMVKTTVVTAEGKKTTTEKIANEKIEKPVSFVLPVASFQGTVALVSHFGDDGALIEGYVTEVKTDGDSKYVELASQRFSSFVLKDAMKISEGYYQNAAETEYYILNLAGLTAFRDAVAGDVNFAGKTVYLEADIDFGETSWTKGIGGTFGGTFDGQGKTIKNLKVNRTENSAGLFGGVFGATIKNLALENPVVSTTGENYAGAIAGNGYAHIENCTVTGGSVTGTDQVGGIIGYLSCGYVKGCTVDGVTITANGDRAGGIAGKANVDSQYQIIGNTVKGCTIVATKKIDGFASAGGIVGQIMASANNAWTITDNNVINTYTKTADDATFVPVGEFRSGNYQADSVTAGHIVRNHWEPATTPDSYTLVNPANTEESVTIANFHPVAQIEGKGLAARYETVAAACEAAQAGETVKLLVSAEDPEVKDFHKSFTLDLNGFTLHLTGSYAACADFKVCNGTLDINGATGGMWVDNQWYWVFHVNPGCTFSFEDLEFKGAPADGCTYPFQTAANCNNAVFAFKDCKIVDFQRSDRIFANNQSKMTFDHCELAFTDVTGVFKNDNGGLLGLLEFTNGSTLTVANTGRGAAVFNRQGRLLIDNSTVDVKNYGHIVSQESNIELANGGKLLVDGAKSHGITGTHDRWDNGMVLIVGSGCELSVSNCANVGINVCGIGSVFKAGSKVSAGGNCRPISVVVDGVETTWNPAASTYNGTEVDLRVHADDLMIENGAEVDIAGYCCVMSAGAATIADGRFKNVKTWNNTAENLVTVSLKGGIYKDEPTPAFVNPYYEKVANVDEATKDAYPWAIAAKPSVAEIFDAESQSLGEIYSFELALAQVPENGTIKLLADASFAITDISKSFKIDPNGKSVEGITLPYGYELKDNEGILTFRKTPIATITRESVTTEFDSLAAACTAAQSGDVIQLAALEIDATDAYVIKDLTGKTVTVKGAGQDKTTLLWGTGKKWGTGSNSYLTGANITFEDLAVTIAHDSGMPYVQWMDHPASQTFRNVKINGLIVTMDPAVFDGCTFAGPQQNSAKGAPDEYLIWNYGNHVYVTNCTFAASGTHAPIKLYNDSGVKCSATVVDTTFAAVGDESGAITTANSSDNFAYDIQIDVDSVTVPAGATLIGYDPNYGSIKVNMVNGTTDATGKYTSGAIFSDRGTDEQILAIVTKIVAEGYTALPYTGSATVLGNYRWYIGPQQLQPKTDEAEADASDAEKANVPQEIEDRGQKINDAVDLTKEKVSEAATSSAVTQFAESGLDEAVVNSNGSLDSHVVEELQKSEGLTDEQKELIAQLASDSNSTKRIQIELKKIDVGLAVVGEAVVGSANEVTYVVEPRVKTVIKVKDEQGGVTDTIVSDAKVPNTTIANSPITFRLGVTWAVGEQVKVLRDDVNFGITYVKGDGDEHYVELTSNHFSSFKLMKVENVTTVCEVNGQAFESVAKAIAASEESPTAVIKLTAACNEENLPLLWGQELDLNGQEFTGSITPVAEPGSGFEASDYVQVKTPAGRVFSAPKQVIVPLDDSTEPAKIKIRIAGKAGDELKGVQASGRPLWQDLAMGSTEKLIPQVLRSAIGSKTITIRGTISDEAVAAAAKARDGVSVKYQLMKKVGSGAFAQFGEAQDKPVFTVEADELEVQTFWKIQTIFDEEY